jgi:hypothetical protein
MDSGAEGADQNQDDVAGHGRLRSTEDQSDVSVTEDVEGHGRSLLQDDEPAQDEDVEGHGVKYRG